MVYRFGDCQLDEGRLELRRGDRAEPIEPQVFALLLYLVQNRGRVVTRAELNQAVWNGRIVTDSALTSCIKAARHAIGDDGKSQSRIRTLHRKGYRFVGSVSEQPAPPASAAVGAAASASSEGDAPAEGRAAPEPVTSATPAANRPLRLAAGALGLVLVVLGGFGMRSLLSPSASEGPAEVVQLSIPDVGPPTLQPFGTWRSPPTAHKWPTRLGLDSGFAACESRKRSSSSRPCP